MATPVTPTMPSAPAMSTTTTAPGPAIRTVEPAPPVRTRPARPEQRPEIKLSPSKEESRFVGPIPIAIGMFALAVTLGFAHRVISKADDPNYLQAMENLNQYELGLTELKRNYDAPVYIEVLDALAKVEPDSISADKASGLTADINARTELFHRRIAARTEAELALQNSLANRDGEYLAARERDLLMPRKSYQECEEGEGKHEHKH